MNDPLLEKPILIIVQFELTTEKVFLNILEAGTSPRITFVAESVRQECGL